MSSHERSWGWLLSVGALFGTSCAAPAAPAAAPQPVVVTELTRFVPMTDNTVLSYETSSEGSSERGIAVFEIKRPRPDMAELSIAGQVRRRYYFEPGGIRSSKGGYLLKSPLALDSRWTGDDGQVHVASLNQSVDVPAGKFSGCLQTVEEAKLPGATRTTTTVFCPGVGIAVLEIAAEGEGTSVLERLSLKSFGPRFTGL